MTRVCFVGSPDVTLQYELLSRETSREALATYDLTRPFENAIALRTVSLGAAVSLCNDLQWYLVRFVDTVLIQEPSVSESEWLSRELAVALRNGELEPEDTGEHLLIYGLEKPDGSPESEDDRQPDHGSAADDSPTEAGQTQATQPSSPVTRHSPRLVDPLYARRTDGEIPAYDLRDVDDTLVVRLTESEFSA